RSVAPKLQYGSKSQAICRLIARIAVWISSSLSNLDRLTTEMIMARLRLRMDITVPGSEVSPRISWCRLRLSEHVGRGGVEAFEPLVYSFHGPASDQCLASDAHRGIQLALGR